MTTESFKNSMEMLVEQSDPKYLALCWDNFLKMKNNGMDEIEAEEILKKELESYRGKLRTDDFGFKLLTDPEEAKEIILNHYSKKGESYWEVDYQLMEFVKMDKEVVEKIHLILDKLSKIDNKKQTPIKITMYQRMIRQVEEIRKGEEDCAESINQFIKKEAPALEEEKLKYVLSAQLRLKHLKEFLEKLEQLITE